MSLTRVIDNCGVKITKTIHHYFGFFKQTSHIGHFMKVSVRKRKKNYSWVKSKRIVTPRKGKRLKAYLIKSRYGITKGDGSKIRYKFNGNVILKKRLTIKGKYTKGPFLYGLNRRKILKSFAGLL